MSTEPTKLQTVAQRNGGGPRVPRQRRPLTAEHEAIATAASARIVRLGPGRHRNNAPVAINHNGHEVSRADCLCELTFGVYCPRCAPSTYAAMVAPHRSAS